MPPDGNREEKWDFTNTQPAYTPCDTDLAVSPAAGSSSSSSRRVDPGVEQLTMDEDGYAETYVSAVESPNHFWLQVVREKSRALDRLVDDMNAHYALCPPSEEDEVVPRPGDLVATDFVYDNGWYRARVLTVTGDLVTVYYPDFGDTGQVLASRLRKLSRAFLVLPFQAIECYTARQMAPADGGDAWSEAAIQRFEELVFCAKWKVLMCSVMQTEAGRPYVELVDTHGNANVNIADEMVRSGQARWASAADHAHVAPSDDHCSQVTPPAEADDSVIIIDNSPAKVDEAAEDSSQSHRGEASLQSSFGEFSMLQSTGIESSPYDSEPDVDVTETIDSTSSFLSASDDGSSTHLIDSTVSVTDASSFAYESSVQDASAIAPGDTAANTGSADARRNGGGDGGDGNSELGGNTTSGEYSLLSSTKFASESPPVTSPNKRAAGDMESTVLVASPPGGTGKGEFPSGIEDISMIPGNAASSSMIDGSTMQDSAATINPLELNQFSATFEQISRDAAAADDE
ncbi:PREDICTED: tudor domain-containing protein 1-like [Priapulus caudatus]|uniref:Tudor domain-containing protein 1-like n=1 Tax=Priapulus caudatus TaxID=37621 RepID=A0ABM1EYF0_PRICU|nr:PREDICTED: tudor domain-containing protein 1-like [Priapulus caudatus]